MICFANNKTLRTCETCQICVLDAYLANAWAGAHLWDDIIWINNVAATLRHLDRAAELRIGRQSKFAVERCLQVAELKFESLALHESILNWRLSSAVQIKNESHSVQIRSSNLQQLYSGISWQPLGACQTISLMHFPGIWGSDWDTSKVLSSQSQSKRNSEMDLLSTALCYCPASDLDSSKNQHAHQDLHLVEAQSRRKESKHYLDQLE